MRYKRLGDILIDEKLITPDQLQAALQEQKRLGGRLGEVLVNLGLVNFTQIATAVGKQLGVPFVDFASGKLKPDADDEELRRLFNYDFAMKNVCLPLSRSMSAVTVAMADPTDIFLIDNLRRMTGSDVTPVIAMREDIQKAIELYFGKSSIIKNAIQDTYEDHKAQRQVAPVVPVEKKTQEISLEKIMGEDAPVVKLVDLIIHQAIQEKASDIHIEPGREKPRLRYRVDGDLHEMPAPTKAIYPALVSRIKILSKMDIAEKRMPQDGTFSVSYETKVIDLRVSCLPLIYGEKIVIRILDQSRVPLDLSKMGYIPEELDLMRKGLNAPYGLVFLTGPTGSGKSTSLYGALNEIVSPELNVMTAEDPVEYKIDGINHVQVKPDIGLTFATVLRSFLRQDPDIILVGEVRDQETGEICLKAALTGHLVLSTLHTNDALSAVTRLEDMGLPSYLLASGLRLIIAQRLLRKLCPHCKEAYELTRKEYGTYTLKADIAYNAKGCEKCNFVGYKGRTPIAEVVLVNDDLRNLIVKRATISEMMPVAQKNGTLTLFQSGMRRVEEGITSVEEVMATAYE